MDNLKTIPIKDIAVGLDGFGEVDRLRFDVRVVKNFDGSHALWVDAADVPAFSVMLLNLMISLQRNQQKAA